MSYAVVQQSLEVPSQEQLKSAFRNVDGLTEIDALALGRDAFGIFARGFELELASALKDSLASEGVAAEVVDDANLPQLPEPLALNHFECVPEGLQIHDPLGRVKTVAWTEVFLIAAGRVAVQEFVEVHPASPNHVSEAENRLRKQVDSRAASTDPRRVYSGKHMHWQVKPVDVQTREEAHERYLMEILLTDGSHYSVNADKTPLLFACLGDRRTENLSQNFILILRDLFKYAPQAALNRGAYSAQENSTGPFSYPNKIAFNHELVWLLWMSARTQTTAEENSLPGRDNNA